MEPDWMAKMRREGRLQEKGINLAALGEGIGVNPTAFGEGLFVAAELYDDQSEAEFQREVIQYAQDYEWKVAHFRKARKKDGGWVTAVAADGKGFFDLILVRGGDIIFAELKVHPNKLMPEQERWAEWMRGVTSSVYCWYPEDWETIRERLK